jgi:mRNA interferase RelE/StbE
MMAEAFAIIFAEEALADIRSLRAFDQRKVVEGIETHLASDPTAVSRSRIKAMNQPFWSQYRLRVDDFRIYYDVDEPAHRIDVLRVLRKTNTSTPETSP